MPIGLEENFEGIIDLIKMKAYYFEGDMGNKVIEKDLDTLPENLKIDAEKNLHPSLDEDISSSDSAVRVLIIRAQEEWAIARACWKIFARIN